MRWIKISQRMRRHDGSPRPLLQLGPMLRHCSAFRSPSSVAEHESNTATLSEQLGGATMPGPDGVSHQCETAHPCNVFTCTGNGLVIRVTIEFVGRHEHGSVGNALRQCTLQFNLTGAESAVRQSQTDYVGGRQLELAHCAYKLPSADAIQA